MTVRERRPRSFKRVLCPFPRPAVKLHLYSEIKSMFRYTI